MAPEAWGRLQAVLPLTWAARELLPLLRAANQLLHTTELADAASPRSDDFLLEGGERLTQRIVSAVGRAVADLEAGVLVSEVPPQRLLRPPAPSDREGAAVAWERLSLHTGADRLWLVEQCAEYHAWALAELLCHESVGAAARDVDAANGLANLALAVARRVPGDGIWRRRVLGYARVFHANALRAAGKLAAARREMASALHLWKAGAAAAPADLLAEWRVLDLEASLCRDTRQFETALSLLQRAVAMAPASARGRILLKRGLTLEQAGDPVAALATLDQAEAALVDVDDRRLSWLLRYNQAVNHCHLGRYTQVEAQVPLLRQAVAEGNPLDLLRVDWLTGRTEAGLGRWAKACAIFQTMRKDLAARNDPMGTGLVTLELAVLYLEQGRTAEVRVLALEMAWVLKAEGLERDVLAALRLFREAALREEITATEVRKLLASVQSIAGQAVSL
jgi:tetratricopeptide (TPR) repeat protein